MVYYSTMVMDHVHVFRLCNGGGSLCFCSGYVWLMEFTVNKTALCYYCL